MIVLCTTILAEIHGGSLLPRVVPVTGLDGQILLLRGQMNFVEANPVIRWGRVADAVLIAQIFRDAAENFIDAFFLGNFEQALASLR